MSRYRHNTWILFRMHIDKPEAKVQSKSQIPGLGLSLNLKPPHHHPTPPHHPKTFWRSGWEYMVQIEAPSTPECQEGIPSQGGQWWEEDRVVHHVQEEHYQGNFKWSKCSKWTIKMCLCDRESPVGNPLHNSKFKFRACPYRPRRSSLNYYLSLISIP